MIASNSEPSLIEKSLTIFGDGYQIRDLLYVEDLINAYQLAINNIKKVIVHNHVVIFKLKHGTSYILPIETSDKAELAKIRGKL